MLTSPSEEPTLPPMTATASARRRPPGPAPVTRNPLSLLAYMRRMRSGAAERIAERFAQYEAQVRSEYAWVEEATFRSRRREVLTGFLARPTIYGTAHFQALLEAAARANLQRSIERLEARP